MLQMSASFFFKAFSTSKLLISLSTISPLLFYGKSTSKSFYGGGGGGGTKFSNTFFMN
jgi:hypothetical protein